MVRKLRANLEHYVNLVSRGQIANGLQTYHQFKSRFLRHNRLFRDLGYVVGVGLAVSDRR